MVSSEKIFNRNKYVDSPQSKNQILFKKRILTYAIISIFIIQIFVIPSAFGELYGDNRTIDNSPDTGLYCSIAMYLNYPYFSYYDDNTNSLKFSDLLYRNVKGETVDNGGVGQYSSISMNGHTPHISYYDQTNKVLKYATFDGSYWHPVQVDQPGVGKYTSIDLSGDTPHISYYDETNQALKYATYNGASWDISIIDNGGVGEYSSIALYGSYPHISYYDKTNKSLKYATYNGASWDISTIDTGGVGKYSSIALSGSTPYISYFDETNEALKYAVKSGYNWITSTVDSGMVGKYTSIAVSGTTIHISYCDYTNGALKYAKWNGAYWDIIDADTGGVGEYTSISLDSSDKPHISYFDFSNDHLKYCVIEDGSEPDVPRYFDVSAEDKSIKLTWNPPEDTGGPPITGYNIYRGESQYSIDFYTSIGNQTSYTDNSVEFNTYYYYQVSAVNIIGESYRTTYYSAYVSPTTPSRPNLNLKALDKSIELTWTEPSNNGGAEITGYKIYRGTTTDNIAYRTTLTNVYTYTDTSLINGQVYYYQVSALNSVGEGTKSKVESMTPIGLPGNPLNPNARLSGNSITITWEPPNENGGSKITQYKIYRSPDPNNFRLLRSIGNQLSFVDTQIEIGEHYYYYITAVTSQGEGPKSNTVKISEPTTPLTFRAESNDEYITLLWDPPYFSGGCDITSYNIYRGLSESNMNLYTTVENGLSFVDNDVENGKYYYYKISAVNIIGEGESSSTNWGKPEGPPSQPINLNVEFDGGMFRSASIYLSWDYPIDDGGAEITFYKIYRGTSETSLEFLTETDKPFFRDESVEDGKQYYYKVSAVNSVNEGTQTTAQSTDVPSFLIFYIFIVVSIIIAGVIIRMKYKAFRAHVHLSRIRQQVKSYGKKETGLHIQDLMELLDTKEGKSILKAEKMLKSREDQYQTFMKTQDSLKDINVKIDSLAKRVADGTIQSGAYKKARNNLEREKKDFEEEYWKLRNDLFREEYEKPF